MSKAVSSNYSSLASQAGGVADSLTSAENQYLAAVKSGDKGSIAEAEVQYRDKQAAYESMMQMIKNRYETMMRTIRNMSVS